MSCNKIWEVDSERTKAICFCRQQVQLYCSNSCCHPRRNIGPAHVAPNGNRRYVFDTPEFATWDDHMDLQLMPSSEPLTRYQMRRHGLSRRRLESTTTPARRIIGQVRKETGTPKHHKGQEAKVIDVMNGATHPLTSAEIASESGVNRNTVRGIIVRLRRQGRITKAGNNRYRPAV